MDPESKKLKRLAKSFLKKEELKRLYKIKDRNEFNEAVKYSILNFLRKEYEFFVELSESLERQGKDVFVLKQKLEIIPSKIQYFKIDFDKKELNKIVDLLRDINKVAENVQSV